MQRDDTNLAKARAAAKRSIKNHDRVTLDDKTRTTGNKGKRLMQQWGCKNAKPDMSMLICPEVGCAVKCPGCEEIFMFGENHPCDKLLGVLRMVLMTQDYIEKAKLASDESDSEERPKIIKPINSYLVRHMTHLGRGVDPVVFRYLENGYQVDQPMKVGGAIKSFTFLDLIDEVRGEGATADMFVPRQKMHDGVAAKKLARLMNVHKRLEIDGDWATPTGLAMVHQETSYELAQNVVRCMIINKHVSFPNIDFNADGTPNITWGGAGNQLGLDNNKRARITDANWNTYSPLFPAGYSKRRVLSKKFVEDVALKYTLERTRKVAPEYARKKAERTEEEETQKQFLDSVTKKMRPSNVSPIFRSPIKKRSFTSMMEHGVFGTDAEETKN